MNCAKDIDNPFQGLSCCFAVVTGCSVGGTVHTQGDIVACAYIPITLTHTHLWCRHAPGCAVNAAGSGLLQPCGQVGISSDVGVFFWFWAFDWVDVDAP